jgi:RNA-binding protein
MAPAICTGSLPALCYHARFRIDPEQRTTAMELTSAQIKRLRAEGHRLKLKPVVTIGQKGQSDALHAEIDSALVHHELLKMRIPGLNKAEKRELGQQICKHHEANLVEGIGNVIVIYRCNPETNRFAQLLD